MLFSNFSFKSNFPENFFSSKINFAALIEGEYLEGARPKGKPVES